MKAPKTCELMRNIRSVNGGTLNVPVTRTVINKTRVIMRIRQKVKGIPRKFCPDFLTKKLCMAYRNRVQSTIPTANKEISLGKFATTQSPQMAIIAPMISFHENRSPRNIVPSASAINTSARPISPTVPALARWRDHAQRIAPIPLIIEIVMMSFLCLDHSCCTSFLSFLREQLKKPETIVAPKNPQNIALMGEIDGSIKNTCFTDT